MFIETEVTIEYEDLGNVNFSGMRLIDNRLNKKADDFKAHNGRFDMFWFDVKVTNAAQEQTLSFVFAVDPCRSDPNEFSLSAQYFEINGVAPRCGVHLADNYGRNKIIIMAREWFKSTPEYKQQVEWCKQILQNQ